MARAPEDIYDIWSYSEEVKPSFLYNRVVLQVFDRTENTGDGVNLDPNTLRSFVGTLIAYSTTTTYTTFFFKDTPPIQVVKAIEYFDLFVYTFKEE